MFCCKKTKARLSILTLKLHYGSTQDFLSHVHTDKCNHFLNEVSSLNKLNASGYSGNEPKDLNQQLIAMASREFGFIGNNVNHEISKC